LWRFRKSYDRHEVLQAIDSIPRRSVALMSTVLRRSASATNRWSYEPVVRGQISALPETRVGAESDFVVFSPD
jgi:hypothetical protein